MCPPLFHGENRHTRITEVWDNRLCVSRFIVRHSVVHLRRDNVATNGKFATHNLPDASICASRFIGPHRVDYVSSETTQ